tara:strand:- start:240 stop:467 length:228 start_codon:yes stop_codon:yes gene_type:complete
MPPARSVEVKSGARVVVAPSTRCRRVAVDAREPRQSTRSNFELPASHRVSTAFERGGFSPFLLLPLLDDAELERV